jgi:F-type H+-transporting ATPase subunit b
MLPNAIEPDTTLLMSSAVTVDLDPTFIAHFILFTAFVVLMKDLIFDPLLKVFEERERRTHGAISAARKMDEQTIALKQELDGKLEGIRREAAVDREQVRERVKQLESELMGEARDAMTRELDAGMAAIHIEVTEIRKDLEAHRAPLAAEIASKVLGREVRP